GDLLVVPGHLFTKRAAQPLQRAALELIAQTIRARDRTGVLRDDDALGAHDAGVLVHVDFGDERDIAVVPFVEDARHATAAGDAGSWCAWLRRRARVPGGLLRRSGDDVLQTLIAQVDRKSTRLNSSHT